jgi:hypothetical protein
VEIGSAKYVIRLERERNGGLLLHFGTRTKDRNSTWSGGIIPGHLIPTARIAEVARSRGPDRAPRKAILPLPSGMDAG